MQAVIMVGGEDTRLLSLTNKTHKTLIKVKDKPILDWIIESLKANGIEDYYFVVGHKRSEIKYHLSKYHSDINFKCIYQSVLDGTSNAVYYAKDYVDDDFLVFSGDIIYFKEDVKNLIEWNNSLFYTEMDNHLQEYGTLELTDGYIKYINEKSTAPTTNLVNCGAYHFTQDVFDYIPKTKYDERFGERIITNTINLMIEDGYKFGAIHMDWLPQIMYPEDIKIVEEWLNGKENGNNHKLVRLHKSIISRLFRRK